MAPVSVTPSLEDTEETRSLRENPRFVSPDMAELLKRLREGVRHRIPRRLPDVSQISPSDPELTRLFEVSETSPSVSGHLQISPSDPELKPRPSVPDSVLWRRLPEVSQTSPSVPEVLQTSPSVSGVLQISRRLPVVSQRLPEVSQSSLQRLSEEDETKWRAVGLVSCVVAFNSCALSPTFHRLIGGWNFLKSLLYGVVFLVIFTTIVFARQSSRSNQHVLKKIIGFAVLMFLALFTLYYDKALNGKPDIQGLVSTVAFALVSLSLFKLINFGQEMGIFAFWLTCFVAQLWTINKILILVAIIIGYPLFHMHSFSDSQREVYSSLNSEPEVDSAQVFNSLSSDSDIEVRGGRHHAVDIHT